MAREVGEFLETFVAPLVRGGDVRIGLPVSLDDMKLFERDVGGVSVPLVDVDDARDDVVAELVCDGPPQLVGRDELLLASAVHNLLFLAHPQLERALTTDRQCSRVAETAHLFVRSVPIATDRRRVLARHALLHNLLAVTRADIRISWWTGAAEYVGMQPPARLKRWPSLRRVELDTSFTHFSELLLSPRAAPGTYALLKRSPMTLLLAADQCGPMIRWGECAFLLRDAQLARALAYGCLGGGGHAALVVVPAGLMAAFSYHLQHSPQELDVRAVAAFLVHLNALFALEEIRTPDVRSPLLADVLNESSWQEGRPAGLCELFALPAALGAVEPILAEPPGLANAPEWKARFDQHRAQVREELGSELIAELSESLGEVL